MIENDQGRVASIESQSGANPDIKSININSTSQIRSASPPFQNGFSRSIQVAQAGQTKAMPVVQRTGSPLPGIQRSCNPPLHRIVSHSLQNLVINHASQKHASSPSFLYNIINPELRPPNPYTHSIHNHTSQYSLAHREHEKHIIHTRPRIIIKTEHEQTLHQNIYPQHPEAQHAEKPPYTVPHYDPYRSSMARHLHLKSHQYHHQPPPEHFAIRRHSDIGVPPQYYTQQNSQLNIPVRSSSFEAPQHPCLGRMEQMAMVSVKCIKCKKYKPVERPIPDGAIMYF